LGGVQLVNRERVFVDHPAGRAGEPPFPNLEPQLSRILGQPVRVGLMMTRPYRANRKMLLLAVNRHGRVLAYGKVGANPLTRQLLQRESETLQMLGRHPFRRVEIPTVLFDDEVGDVRVFVVSALRPPVFAPAVAKSTLHAAMRELAMSTPLVTMPMNQSAWWASLEELIKSTADTTVRDELLESAAVVDASFGDCPFTFGTWHGDWTRWNMASRRGRILLWDFERSQPQAPFGFDELHFALSGRIEASLADEDAVLTALRSFPGFSAECAPARATGTAAMLGAYVLVLAVRAAADATTLPSPWADTRARRFARCAARASRELTTVD
jgi:hypothetical protein